MTGLALLQFATGVFFVTTGYRKLFTASGRENVAAMFQSINVIPHRLREPAMWATALGEFFGGLALLTGVLPTLAALGLLLIMAGAYTLVIWPREVWAKHDGTVSKTLSNALCTPEAQLILILTALVIGG